jgi:hypothetical protein
MDYLYNFNNNYLIINSESTKEDVIYVNPNSTLQKEKNIAINNLTKRYNDNIYYYPYLLEYRQGFINNNRDAKLVFLEKPSGDLTKDPSNEHVIQIPSGYACISIHKPKNAQDGVFDESLSLAE